MQKPAASPNHLLLTLSGDCRRLPYIVQAFV